MIVNSPKLDVSQEYVVVRCHAMVQELLDIGKLSLIINSQNVEEFNENLMGTPYGKRIDTLPTDARAIDYERVFQALFLERLERILKVSPEDYISYLNIYYLLRMEIINLKRILRGKYTKLSRERIQETLLPIPPQRIESIEALLDADNVEEMVNLMKKSIYYYPLSNRLEDFKKTDNLGILTVELDNIYLDTLKETIAKTSSINQNLLNTLMNLEVNANTHIANIESDIARVNLQRNIIELLDKAIRTDSMGLPYVFWSLKMFEEEEIEMTRSAYLIIEGINPKQFHQFFSILNKH